MIGGILFYIPGAWLDDRVKSRGRNIDQLLPIAIGRIAAGLLAGGSVPDVLQQVGESLELEKTNPLTPEFVLTASEMRIKDRVEALRSLASRSPSVSWRILLNYWKDIPRRVDAPIPKFSWIFLAVSNKS